MRLLILATLGGALGAGARHLVNVSFARALGPGFPWPTLTVNVAGGLLMGLVVEVVLKRYGGSPELRTFLATGILGGFTTFSAFALDVHMLMSRGEPGLALLYVAASVLLSIGALYAGLALGRSLLA
jgi:fluoride exporter